MEVWWSHSWTPHAYLLISSSPAKILQLLFSCYGCEVQQKLKCVFSSGPKSCAVLTDTAELQQLIFSTLVLWTNVLLLFPWGWLKGFTTDKPTFISQWAKLPLNQPESLCFSSWLFPGGPGWGWKCCREGRVMVVYRSTCQGSDAAHHQFRLIYSEIPAPHSIHSISHV